MAFASFWPVWRLGLPPLPPSALLRAGIQSGLQEQGAVILGGDVEMRFTYRTADAAELGHMDQHRHRDSEVYDFRSMALVEDDQALTQIKAVDDAWPLNGCRQCWSRQSRWPRRCADQDGLPGAIMDPVLIDRLGLAIGDSFRLGTQEFHLSAALIREPDSASTGFTLGPRTVVHDRVAGAIRPSGPRLASSRPATGCSCPPAPILPRWKPQAETNFRDNGLRWTDSRNAAPGIERFVDRIGSFLVLVGLAGLAVGGVGISAAIRSYLDGKTDTIATLKTLGAIGRADLSSYLIQVAILSALGIAIGLVLGALVPLLAAPADRGLAALPGRHRPVARPLVEAAFYGALAALIFTLLPLARSENIRAGRAVSWRRAAPAAGRAARWYLLAWLTLPLADRGGGLAVGHSRTGAWVRPAASLAALVILMLAALALRLARPPHGAHDGCRGRPATRAALAAIGAPRSDAASVILSLGLGLSVLAAVGQIDWNLRAAIATDLPTRAPAFFFVDIQPDQIDAFLARMAENPAVTEIETAPMLRGVLTRINDRPAREVAGDHWVVRGDRGITYAATPGARTRITAGTLWPPDYTGPIRRSAFAAEEAEEMGLTLGDRITVNILGRDITATVTSFREVDFSNAGMGFVMTLNPTALAGAPHTHIATVYAPPEAEAAILTDVSRTWPNITAIRIREAVDRVAEALSAIATATAWAAAGTLITGFVVLIGAAAAGERGRLLRGGNPQDAGRHARAHPGQLCPALGLAGGGCGGGGRSSRAALAGWAVMTFVMETDYRFEPVSALGIVAGGVLATLLAGLVLRRAPAVSAAGAGVAGAGIGASAPQPCQGPPDGPQLAAVRTQARQAHCQPAQRGQPKREPADAQHRRFGRMCRIACKSRVQPARIVRPAGKAGLREHHHIGGLPEPAMSAGVKAFQVDEPRLLPVPADVAHRRPAMHQPGPVQQPQRPPRHGKGVLLCARVQCRIGHHHRQHRPGIGQHHPVRPLHDHLGHRQPVVGQGMQAPKLGREGLLRVTLLQPQPARQPFDPLQPEPPPVRQVQPPHPLRRVGQRGRHSLLKIGLRHGFRLRQGRRPKGRAGLFCKLQRSETVEEPRPRARQQLISQRLAQRGTVGRRTPPRARNHLRSIGPQDLAPQPELIALQQGQPGNRRLARPVQPRQERPLRRQSQPRRPVVNGRQQRRDPRHPPPAAPPRSRPAPPPAASLPARSQSARHAPCPAVSALPWPGRWHRPPRLPACASGSARCRETPPASGRAAAAPAVPACAGWTSPPWPLAADRPGWRCGARRSRRAHRRAPDSNPDTTPRAAASACPSSNAPRCRCRRPAAPLRSRG